MNSRRFTAQYLPCFRPKGIARLGTAGDCCAAAFQTRLPSAGGQCGGPSNFVIEVRSLTHACCERTNICRRGINSFRWRSDPSPDIVGFLFIANRCRIERRAATRAETLQTDVSAIGSLSIFGRFAGQEHERAWTSDNYRPQWSTAHCLAVCAVANGRSLGIGFGLERHVAAVTASINFHDRLLEFRK